MEVIVVLKITSVIIGIIALVIYMLRNKIKAWIIKKVMEYASKKMLETMTWNVEDTFNNKKWK